MIDQQALLVQSPDCAYQIIEGRAIIVLPAERTLHYLDDVGTAIWQFLERPHTAQEVAEFLTSEFDVTLNVAYQDTLDFLKQLMEKGLINHPTP
jgi:hypothetical protein